MKRSGILNPNLLSMFSSVGHTDYITIADRGFPIPSTQNRLDLSVVDGIPMVIDVLAAVYGEFVIDRVIVTEEMQEFSPERFGELQQMFPDLRFDVVTHLELKYLSMEGKGVVRTGDTCPYGNLIIVSG